MVLDIPAKGGSVQVVMTLDTLEIILSRFPRLEVFPVMHDPDDLPTYAFRVKRPAPAPTSMPANVRVIVPRAPRRRPSR